MSKIYTRTGDQGETSLVDGTRVRKDDLRVEAYGTVDELNAHIGLLAEMVQGDALTLVQNDLFMIQTALATPNVETGHAPSQHPDSVSSGETRQAASLHRATIVLEQAIDNITAQLPPLRAFVLPGGTMAAAQCHVCRTVCRRAERRIVSLSQREPVEPEILTYINRLSDFLFVLGRQLVVSAGKEEKLWEASKQ